MSLLLLFPNEPSVPVILVTYVVEVPTFVDIDSTVPIFNSIDRTTGVFQDSIITYNEVGYTYNQSNNTYGGADRFTDLPPIFAVIQNIKPKGNTFI